MSLSTCRLPILIALVTAPVLVACGDSGGGGGDDSGSDTDADAGPPPVDAGPSSQRHTPRPLGSTGAGVGYWEYLPPGYGDGTRVPLLIFHHGIGENDNDPSVPPEEELDEVLRGGPPRLIDRDSWPGDRPFLVLSPQHPGAGCPGAAEIKAFIDHAVAEYDVDERRIYLTGLSCGAIGSWSYMAAHADDLRLAAFVPIAGNGNGAWNAQGCDLARTPIWAFHGDADPIVDVDGTNLVMDNLAGCASPPALETRKTIYPGVDHDSWTDTYNLAAGHDIYTWMLGKTRP